MVPGKICTICQEDLEEDLSPKSCFKEKSIVWLSGNNHLHSCYFHRSCLNEWRYQSSEEEDGSLLRNYPNLTICPNDRCNFSHINGKHIFRSDHYILDLIASIFEFIIYNVKESETVEIEKYIKK